MGVRSSKRTFDQTPSDTNEVAKDISLVKHFKHATISTNDIVKTTFQDLYEDIFLEIFQYLGPIDVLYAFTNLYPLLDTLIEPYTHALDFRLISFNFFQYFSQSFPSSFRTNLRVLRLSNAYISVQISEAFDKWDWSQLNQLESLTFDSIKFDELTRYFHTIHPLLTHLWRLSFTFDEDDKTSEKLLLDRIFTSKSHSLRNCFIIGIELELSKMIEQTSNENLRELTLTLSTINDLISLFRHTPCLEILTCTVMDSTYNDSLFHIPSLAFLTILRLTIKKPIEFRNLRNLLLPHCKLKRLLLQNSQQEIGGLELEKVFRTFNELIELRFSLRLLTGDDQEPLYFKPNDLYLFSFTSRFWRDRSIHVSTRWIILPKQRYIYTLPYAFDTFDIVSDTESFFLDQNPYFYGNVHHLSLSTEHSLNEFMYPTIIIKLFPNIRTITFPRGHLSTKTINLLQKYHWIQQRTVSESKSHPCIYILNKRESTHWYLQKWDLMHEEQRTSAKQNKHIRQLTIYEMTEEQLPYISDFFPFIQVLTLYVDTLEWFSLSNRLLRYLFTHMCSLFSLTIYYPKYTNDRTIYDSLVSTSLAIKKHYYIKCNDGILNIWL